MRRLLLSVWAASAVAMAPSALWGAAGEARSTDGSSTASERPVNDAVSPPRLLRFELNSSRRPLPLRLAQWVEEEDRTGGVVPADRRLPAVEETQSPHPLTRPPRPMEQDPEWFPLPDVSSSDAAPSQEPGGLRESELARSLRDREAMSSSGRGESGGELLTARQMRAPGPLTLTAPANSSDYNRNDFNSGQGSAAASDTPGLSSVLRSTDSPPDAVRLPPVSDSESSGSAGTFQPRRPEWDNDRSRSRMGPLRAVPAPLRAAPPPSSPNAPEMPRRWLPADPSTSYSNRPDTEVALSAPRTNSTANNPGNESSGLPAALSERAEAIARHGMGLAVRGAYYSARAELIRSLRLVAQGLDTVDGVDLHSKQLAAGLVALREAEDFVPDGSHLEADLDLRQLVQSHRTPVLKQMDEGPGTAVQAAEQYYRFAQLQLTEALGHERAASLALYGLGKIQTVLASQPSSAPRSCGPKAIVFHQVALNVDKANYRAANELGVLLARCGELQQAKEVLRLSAQTFSHPEAWHNLAVVHERLGETELARQANQMARSQSASQTLAAGAANELVQWVDVQRFAQTRSPFDSDTAASPALPNSPARAPATSGRSGSFRPTQAQMER